MSNKNMNIKRDSNKKESSKKKWQKIISSNKKELQKVINSRNPVKKFKNLITKLDKENSNKKNKK